jgi:hypothetical protein
VPSHGTALNLRSKMHSHVSSHEFNTVTKNRITPAVFITTSDHHQLQINQLNNMLDQLNSALEEASQGKGPLAGKAIESYQGVLTSLKGILDSLKAGIVSYQPGENIKKVTEPIQQVASAATSGGMLGSLRESISKAGESFRGMFTGASSGSGNSSRPLQKVSEAVQSYRPGSLISQLMSGGDAAAGSSSVLGQFVANGSLDAGVLQLLQNVNKFSDSYSKLFPTLAGGK